MITIDCREGALLRELGFSSTVSTLEPITVRGAQVSVSGLALGDVVMTKTSTLVIERKTVADLVASIHDGRYREQKQRLLLEYPTSHIVYIIEGFCKPLPTDHSKKILGAIVNMQLEHSVTVLCSFDIACTANLVFDLYSKLDIKTRSGDGGIRNDGLSTLTKSSYNSQFPTENCLMTIKGVSFKIAQTIVGVYPTVSDLVNSFNERPMDTRSLLLADLKNGNRRLGNALSTRIYKTLFGVVDN